MKIQSRLKLDPPLFTSSVHSSAWELVKTLSIINLRDSSPPLRVSEVSSGADLSVLCWGLRGRLSPSLHVSVVGRQAGRRGIVVVFSHLRILCVVLSTKLHDRTVLFHKLDVSVGYILILCKRRVVPTFTVCSSV